MANYTYRMTQKLNGRKLFLAFSLLGIVNVILAYMIFYFSTISLVKERSTEQLVSVRALASQKLKLHLDNIKIRALKDSEDIIRLGKQVQGVYVLDANDKTYEHLLPFTLTPEDDHNFILKIPLGNKIVVWHYDYNIFNLVLAEYAGLGKSGEIYLVGMDQKIKSASRHLADWQNTKVQNESFRLGKLYNTGVHIVKDYRGVEVFSAYSLFVYDKLSFVLLSEMDQEEVFATLKELFPKVFFLCAILVLLSIIFAYFFSSALLKLIEQMRTQINQMHVQFINTLEEENKKISFHLHDGVGQILTALKWGVERQEDPEKLKTLCEDAFKEIRNVSGNLMPAELAELGFYPAIRNFLRRQESFFKISIYFWNNERLEKYKFLPGLDMNLYRMIQEFLQNTLKHANATSISIVLFREGDNLVMRYEDDGVGVPDNAPMPKVILYRADLMGATITRPTTQKGLVYQVTVPLKQVFRESV